MHTQHNNSGLRTRVVGLTGELWMPEAEKRRRCLPDCRQGSNPDFVKTKFSVWWINDPLWVWYDLNFRPKE